MSDRLFVSSRKGLFTFERRAGQWTIADTAFLGDPVSLMLDDPRGKALYAALKLGHYGAKLRRSDDAGKTWKEVAAPTYPAAEGEEKPTKLMEIWSLEMGPDGVLWAGTIPGGLFRSIDRGESWSMVESLWNMPQRKEWFGGGADEPGIHSICIHPKDPKNVLVGVSCGGAWLTHNGGETWEPRANGMYANYMPPERREDPNIQDPHRIAQCRERPDAYWCQHHNGIFRTIDAGRNWTAFPEVAPSNFGFGVVVHPSDADTAWFVPGVKDESRYPVDGALVVTRTRDGGKTFDILREGLPQEHSYDLAYRHALDIDSSGERLAFGSTTGNLWLSENGGDHWLTLSTFLPPIYAVRFES